MLSSLTTPTRPLAWLFFLFLAGLAHIFTVLTLASVGPAPSVEKLARTLTTNRMALLDPVTPKSQPVPFLMPGSLYAVCPFDLETTAVRLTAAIPDDGWMLSIHTMDGSSFYFAPGSAEADLTITIDLVPPGDALNALELAPTADDLRIAKVEAPQRKGVAVVRAPVAAKAYAPDVIRQLQKSNCRPVGRNLASR